MNQRLEEEIDRYTKETFALKFPSLEKGSIKSEMIYTAIRFYNLALEDVKKKAIERNRYFIALHDYSNDDYDSGRADGIREILDFIEKQKV